MLVCLNIQPNLAFMKSLLPKIDETVINCILSDNNLIGFLVGAETMLSNYRGGLLSQVFPVETYREIERKIDHNNKQFADGFHKGRLACNYYFVDHPGPDCPYFDLAVEREREELRKNPWILKEYWHGSKVHLARAGYLRIFFKDILDVSLLIEQMKRAIVGAA